MSPSKPSILISALVQLAHTRYRKSVIDAPTSPLSSGLRALKEAATNKKLGVGAITKGRYRGLPLFALTLEERATCWSGCQNWARCYGDGMPFAKRHKPNQSLLEALTADLATLTQRHRAGFVIRLHVLGDFYDVSYVHQWRDWMEQYPTLRVFGYTHWRHDHPIGRAVAELVAAFPNRAAFRRSDPTEYDDPLPPAHTVPTGDPAVQGTVVCPEQTGHTSSCTTCGLCMNTTIGITFLDHSRRRKQAA